MDIANLSMTGSIAQNVPRYLPDLRPTADAAALRNVTRPLGNLALPGLALPAGPGQFAAISRSLAVAEPDAAERTQPVERVLKPFNVPILPGHRMSEPTPSERGTTHARPGADQQRIAIPPHPARTETTGADAGSVTAARVHAPTLPDASVSMPVAAGPTATDTPIALPAADAPIPDAAPDAAPDAMQHSNPVQDRARP